MHSVCKPLICCVSWLTKLSDLEQREPSLLQVVEVAIPDLRLGQAAHMGIIASELAQGCKPELQSGLRGRYVHVFASAGP